MRLLFRLRVRDTDCDFRLIRRVLLDRVELTSTSGVICVEMMRKFQVAGARFAEVGVSHYARPHGRSQFFRLPAIARSARQLVELWWALVVRGLSGNDRPRRRRPAVASPPVRRRDPTHDRARHRRAPATSGRTPCVPCARPGRDVVVLDTLELGRREALLGAPLVEGDIRDATLVQQVCSDYGVTAIVHFAAYKSVGESMQSPGKYWHNNVDGTATLVEAAMRAGVRDIVFSSSCSVYGTPDRGPRRRERADRPRERVRRVQGDRRADPPLVRRSPTGCARSACATSTPPAPAGTP